MKTATLPAAVTSHCMRAARGEGMSDPDQNKPLSVARRPSLMSTGAARGEQDTRVLAALARKAPSGNARNKVLALTLLVGAACGGGYWASRQGSPTEMRVAPVSSVPETASAPVEAEGPALDTQSAHRSSPSASSADAEDASAPGGARAAGLTEECGPVSAAAMTAPEGRSGVRLAQSVAVAQLATPSAGPSGAAARPAVTRTSAPKRAGPKSPKGPSKVQPSKRARQADSRRSQVVRKASDPDTELLAAMLRRQASPVPQPAAGRAPASEVP